MKKISVGSDPEEFDISEDGRHLYVSNEDVKTASSVDIANGKVDHIVPLTQEPEGVAVTPDGKTLIVTCETGGDVFFIDIATIQGQGAGQGRLAAALGRVPRGRQARGHPFRIRRQSLWSSIRLRSRS